jgi:hypothetical protein
MVELNSGLDSMVTARAESNVEARGRSFVIRDISVNVNVRLSARHNIHWKMTIENISYEILATSSIVYIENDATGFLTAQFAFSVPIAVLTSFFPLFSLAFPRHPLSRSDHLVLHRYTIHRRPPEGSRTISNRLATFSKVSH